MTKSVTLTDPDPRFTEFIEKSNALDGAKLAAAIPKEYVQPSLARGILGLAASLSVYVGAIVAMAVLDRWYLVVPWPSWRAWAGGACTASHTSAGTDHSPEIAG